MLTSTLITQYLIVIGVVGFVTGAIQIRFDRFFAIIMLLFVMHYSIRQSIDIYLWILMLGALMILVMNRAKIVQAPAEMKKKLFLVVPVITLIFSYLGSLLYFAVSSKVLIIGLAVLAVLYGLRLIGVHFKPHELDYTGASPALMKLCGLFGPIISGFSIGFIGSSLKALKIPLGVKTFKLNAKQIYLGNAVSTMFAAMWTIIFHYILKPSADLGAYSKDSLMGIAVWIGITIVFLTTDKLFPNSWRKPFQIFIGFALLAAAVKIYMLA